MYQVIEMYGDSEPWWFFPEWQKDIEQEEKFNDLPTALTYYKKKSHELAKTYPNYKLKGKYLVAFWQEGDLRFCEECDDDLQQYKGLLLLKDWQLVEIDDSLLQDPVVGNASKKQCPYRQGNK